MLEYSVTIEVTEMHCRYKARAMIIPGDVTILGHGSTKRDALTSLRRTIHVVEALLTNADVEISNILDNL